MRLEVCCPASKTRDFLGYRPKCSITAAALSEAAEISTSPTVEAWRRRLPKGSARLTWGDLLSHSITESAISWATGSSIRRDLPRNSAMDLMIADWESSPKPSIWTIRPAAAGLIVHIEGFGEDSQSAIIKSIAEFRGRSRRMLLPVAQEIADSVIEWLSKSPHVKRADPLGSLRRQASTVGDVDISAASDNSAAVIEHFGRYPKKSRVLEAGQHTSSLILGNGYQVDLMIQPPDSYGSLLQHFTGSKHHNILLREFALKKGYSLSEYGIRKLSKSLTKFSDEESFYNFLGLQYIPPELREGHDEIRFAQSNSLPELVELDDIKGDFQIHSNIDVEPGHDLGESSLTQLAETAESLNYQYLGITEHNPSVSGHTQKQILNLIKHKTELVNVFNTSHENRGEKRVPYIFNGLEIDILPDGTRALPESALDLLDFACVSIPSSFRPGRQGNK